MHMSEREERFEKMLNNVLKNYENTVLKLEKLKAEDKIKTVTYRQLTADKLKYQNIIDMYKFYDLIEE